MKKHKLPSIIQLRRLTEAARSLAYSDAPIVQIAPEAGYDTQQSFTVGLSGIPILDKTPGTGYTKLAI